MTFDPTKLSLSRISPTVRTEPDRSAAILAGVLLDDQLVEMLRAHFLRRKETEALFHSDGPLSSFATRNRMAFAAGLIPKHVYSDIDKIRQIRNHFAHRIEGLSFESSPVSDIARSLHAVQTILDNGHLGDPPMDPKEVLAISGSPRRRFEVTAAALSVMLDRLRVSLVPIAEAKPFLEIP